jgi:quercetin dioxygenase-like cupin family protein
MIRKYRGGPSAETAMKNRTIITVFGEAIEIVASSTSTNYTVVMGVQTSPPGGGPPPHRHLGEDEMFTVIDGEYEFFDGTAWTPFGRGETRYSLRGNYHGFRNIGHTNGGLVFMTNGGGLDEYFAAISPLRLPEDMERLNEISRFYRYEYLQAG